MKPCILPHDEVFWYIHTQDIKPLAESLKVDVVIVGGGMAGLSAAQAFHEKGMRVVVLEKNFCGAGATGKSSGFVTPNSELSLSDFVRFYGIQEAHRLWEFVCSGVMQIKKNIKNFDLACDYQEQETLVIATSEAGFKKLIEPEHRLRVELGYDSHLYQTHDVPRILGSDTYYGGIAYGDSFGVSGYRYCHSMKKVLEEQGVGVYESSPVVAIEDHTIVTPRGTVTADHIIIATDQSIPWLSSLKSQVYHVETFLMMSAPLSETQVKRVFPNKKYMTWDTNLIYNYFRLAGDNRLMIGGSDLWYTYARQQNYNSKKILKKLAGYISRRFPGLDVTFEYIWPGMLGVSKDFLPIAGADAQKPWIYYTLAATGLPWAAAIGNYSADALINKRTDFDSYLSPYREVKLGSGIQSILGTQLTFALSHVMRTSSF